MKLTRLSSIVIATLLVFGLLLSACAPAAATKLWNLTTSR